MDYQEARTWLENVSKRGSRLGLERMRALVRELSDPQDGLKFVHIAGTNGKGSVLTFLEHTLALAGYRVGRYLSPAVFRYEERFRVDEKEISGEELARLTEILRDACGRMEKRGEELPTIFEVETALAFLFFRRRGCDIVLLETGMGGETDATNVVTGTLLEIFSSISLDHMEYLGDSVEAIAAVKAGILKPGSLAVSAPQERGAREVLSRAAREKKVPLTFADPGRLSSVRYGLTEQSFCYRTDRRAPDPDGRSPDGTGGGELRSMRIGMAGTWQVLNACTALEAVEALRSLGFDLPEEAVQRGFAQARIEGRFEVVRREPLIILDGAHNPGAVRRLRETLLACFPEFARRASDPDPAGPMRGTGKLILVMGVLADKDYREEISLMAPLADQVYTVQARDNPRALPAGILAGAVRPVNPNVFAAGDPAAALDAALAGAGRADVILLFGSLSWLAEAREHLQGGMRARPAAPGLRDG